MDNRWSIHPVRQGFAEFFDLNFANTGNAFLLRTDRVSLHANLLYDVGQLLPHCVKSSSVKEIWSLQQVMRLSDVGFSSSFQDTMLWRSFAAEIQKCWRISILSWMLVGSTCQVEICIHFITTRAFLILAYLPYRLEVCPTLPQHPNLESKVRATLHIANQLSMDWRLICHCFSIGKRRFDHHQKGFLEFFPGEACLP